MTDTNEKQPGAIALSPRGELDGGPTFPATRHEYHERSQPGVPNSVVVYPGMSMRDWYAGSAREADIMAHQTVFETDANGKKPVRELTREEARYAYADAMLAVRGRPK